MHLPPLPVSLSEPFVVHLHSSQAASNDKPDPPPSVRRRIREPRPPRASCVQRRALITLTGLFQPRARIPTRACAACPQTWQPAARFLGSLFLTPGLSSQISLTRRWSWRCRQLASQTRGFLHLTNPHELDVYLYHPVAFPRQFVQAQLRSSFSNVSETAHADRLRRRRPYPHAPSCY